MGRRGIATPRQLAHIKGEWALVDDGLSRNGSYLNGERVKGRHRLRDGDRALLRPTVVLYRAPIADNSNSTAVTAGRANPGDLSPTQLKVLVALCRPMATSAFATPPSNKEIADELFLSVDAVKAQLRTLFERFGLTDLPQTASARAWRDGVAQRHRVAARPVALSGFCARSRRRRARPFPGKPGTAASSSAVAAGSGRDCRSAFQQQALARRAERRAAIEHRARHVLVAAAAVELDREAVALRPGRAAGNCSAGVSLRQHDRGALAGQEDLLDPLARLITVTPRSRTLAAPAGCRELASCHRRSRSGSARSQSSCRSPVVRRALTVARRTAPSAARALRQSRQVVLRRFANLEAR